MSDQTNEQSQADDQVEQDQNQADDREQEAGDNSAPEHNGEDLSPEVLRKNLERANREAASYRTKLREAQEQLKSAKTEDEFNAAITDLNSKIAELDKELIYERYGIEEDLRPLIAGSTAEEWEASAKLIQQRLGKAKTEDPPAPPDTLRDPAGSRQKAGALSQTDPRDAARRALSRR